MFLESGNYRPLLAYALRHICHSHHPRCFEDLAASSRAAHGRMRQVVARVPQALRVVHISGPTHPARILQALPAVRVGADQDKGTER